MFSFHKPKIYRSLQGCCICKAKSSSSRFTDSKRYEGDFMQCFQIREERQGEICNACVLLVKRYKKLPTGSTKNWHHVVDARAGPGTKSITKIKNRAKEELKEDKKLKKHKHRYQPKKNRPAPSSRLPSPALSDEDYDMSDDDCADVPSDASDFEDSVDNVFQSDLSESSRRSRCKRMPARFGNLHALVDDSYWKKTEVCCGIVYVGANNDLLIDEKSFKPCGRCSTPSPKGVRTPGKRLISESSVESGESGVVCPEEEDLKYPTPPDTQPPSPVSEEDHSMLSDCSQNPFSSHALNLSHSKTVSLLAEEKMLSEDEELDEIEQQLVPSCCHDFKCIP